MNDRIRYIANPAELRLPRVGSELTIRAARWSDFKLRGLVREVDPALTIHLPNGEIATAERWHWVGDAEVEAATLDVSGPDERPRNAPDQEGPR